MDALGLKKINNIEEALEARFGKDRAKAITEEWERLSKEVDLSDSPGKQNELYEYLHADPELSMIVTGYTDAEILREIGLWLYDHQALFGKEILDAGCGTGILSCFLGLLLSSAKVKAVDRCESCIRTAQWIKSEMQADNVDFACVSLKQAAEQTFDTVLSVRTFHENLPIRPTGIRFLSFSEQVKTYENIYAEYLGILGGFVRPGGRLICIERNRMDTELYSILQQFKNLGFLPEEMKELQCRESDFAEPSVFQILVLKKQGDEIAAEEDLFRLWAEHAFSRSENPEYFSRAQADWFIETYSDGLLEGYTTFDSAGIQLAKAFLLKYQKDPDSFLMYQANYGKAGVKILPMEALGEAQEVFADHKTIDAARGFRVEELQSQ